LVAVPCDSGTECDRTDFVDELAATALSVDYEVATFDRYVEPSAREGSEKEDVLGSLRQVDGPSTARKSATGSALVDVAGSVAFGNAEEHGVQPAAVDEVER